MKKDGITFSKYYGVRFNLRKYLAACTINKKIIHLGSFEDEISAALAYDNFVIKHNLNRRLNFPEPEPYNPIPNTRLIRLTRGQFAVVDEGNFEWLNKHTWSLCGGKVTYYARRRGMVDGIIRPILMHRQILGFPDLDVDHENHNGLHNYLSNMRVSTKSENARNRKSHRGSSSIYKGVCWDGRINRWVVHIWKDGKSYNLGTYIMELDAAMAYDVKAKELFGEFAYLNFPDQK